MNEKVKNILIIVLVGIYAVAAIGGFIATIASRAYFTLDCVCTLAAMAFPVAKSMIIELFRKKD